MALRNVIERAIVLEDGDLISAASLPESILPRPRDTSRLGRLSLVTETLFNLPAEGISLEQLETSLLKQALARSDGNQTQAAKLLGLTRDQFRYRWKKFRASNRPRLVAVAGSRV